MLRVFALLLPLSLLGYTASAYAAELGTLSVETTLPRGGYALAYGFDSLWMMSDGQLLRIDPADGSFQELALPTSGDTGLVGEADRYRGIAVGEGAVWVPDVVASTIYKVDPGSNRVAMTVGTDIFGAQGSIGVGEGSLWVITFDDRNKTLTRYRALDGSVEAKIKMPRPCNSVLVAYGSVWVTAVSSSELYQIDPKTNALAATIALQDSSHLMAAAEGSVWVFFDAQGIVERIDVGVGKVTATVSTGITDMEGDGDIAEGAGYLWVINRNSVVSKIDPTSNSALGNFAPPRGTAMGRRIRYGAGSLWISGASVFKIPPPGGI